MSRVSDAPETGAQSRGETHGAGRDRTMNERNKPPGQQQMDSAATRSKRPTTKPPKLTREVLTRLGQQLRAMHDDVVNQGVPDRFADLVNRIDGNGSKDKQ